MVASDESITRSFTYPILRFEGEDSAFFTQTITWYTNGTTAISDSQGREFSFNVAPPQASFVLLQNSTLIAQRVSGPNSEYYVFWQPVENSQGFIDKYKFTIAGNAFGASKISFHVNNVESVFAHENKMMTVDRAKTFSASSDNEPDVIRYATQGSRESAEYDEITLPKSNGATRATLSDLQETVSKGLGLDWSDAIAAGYAVTLDRASSNIDIAIPQGEQFYIDPFLVSLITTNISPFTSSAFQGETRIFRDERVTPITFVFYHDGSNIVYRTTTGDGHRWSSPTTVSGTGVLDGDVERWEVMNAGSYVMLWFAKDAPDPSKSRIYHKFGVTCIDGRTICWDAAQWIIESPDVFGCNGMCAAISATTSGSGFHTVFKFKNSNGWQYTIYKYSIGSFCNPDCPLSWSSTTPITSVTTSDRFPMTIAPLASGNALLTYATAEGNEIFYRVSSSSGTTWGPLQTTSGANMPTSTIKQISSYSDSSKAPYLVYTTGGFTGQLQIARWDNAGAFLNFETADGDTSRSHSLPSLTITSDGVVRVHSVGQLQKIYETTKVSGVWQTPVEIYGPVGIGPNKLTGGVKYEAALWVQNTFDLVFDNTVANTPPTANAGPDQVVETGTLVTLNGGSSSDPEGDVLDYY
ncbi:MAG: hypothetical protein ACREAW_08045, partial [Nitrososphaera sp.]